MASELAIPYVHLGVFYQKHEHALPLLIGLLGKMFKAFFAVIWKLTPNFWMFSKLSLSN